MYESIETIRDAALARLDEIERELAGYEELLAERDRLREVLALPPLKGGSASANGAGNGRARARRGENVELILAFVAEHPGATVSAIAGQTGISKGVVYNTVRVLVQRGQLEMGSSESGVRTYRVARVVDAR